MNKGISKTTINLFRKGALQTAIWSTILFCISMTAHAERVCNVQNYGAKPDGTTMDTQAIQHAIDSCAAKGCGIVRLSGGTFLTGPIVLKSHITLDITKGSTLLGTQNMADYPQAEELRQKAYEPLIGAKDAVDVTIRGGGTINGAGQPWWKAVYSHVKSRFTAAQRPRLILLDHCKHVLIENMTIENSPSWTVVPYYCDYVTIRNSKILAPPWSPNTDGIDPFSSHHVTITHMLINNGDDNVAIKSGQPGSKGYNSPSTYIRVTDCTFIHGHGMSIGSEVSGGVQHVYVSNIHFDETSHGIRVKSNRGRGGNIGDFVFRNLSMKDVKQPIVITEYYPKIPKHPKAEPMTPHTPRFHNITISNLTATGAHSAGIIIGLPESPVRAFQLSNVHIHAKTGMTISFATVKVHNFTITTTKGKPITLLQGAKIVKK